MKFIQLLEAVLLTEEKITDKGYYMETTDDNFVPGVGIPDLTGAIKNFCGRVTVGKGPNEKNVRMKNYAWNTPARNIGKSYVYKAAILGDSNSKNQRTVIFYKMVAGFDPTREEQKLTKFIKSEYEGGFDVDEAASKRAKEEYIDKKKKEIRDKYKDGGDLNDEIEEINTLLNSDIDRTVHKTKDVDVSIYTQIDDIIRVRPEIINYIGKRECTYGELINAKATLNQQGRDKAYWGNEYERYKNVKRAGDFDAKTIRGNRDEIGEQVKEYAKKLAKEKMQMLMANGVSREDALAAAKEAYPKFIKQYQAEYYKKNGFASGPNRIISTNTTHPLMTRHGNAIKNMRSAGAKEAMQNAYRRALNSGKSKEEAKAEAIALYNKMMGNQ